MRRRHRTCIHKQSKDVFSEEKAFSGTSSKRLSHQMGRFLSVADKLYPAWQVGCVSEKGVLRVCPTSQTRRGARKVLTHCPSPVGVCRSQQPIHVRLHGQI